MNRLIVALGAAGMLLSSGAAFSNPFAKNMVHVRTDDLNLSNAGDRARLDMRIADAAVEVCGRGMSSIHLALEAKSRACQADVIANLKPQMDAMAGKAVRLASVSSVPGGN